jgi:acetylornithine deacetylase
MDVHALTRTLIDIPSISGSEQAVLAHLEELLSSWGLSAFREPVGEHRWNLYAGWDGIPDVCFSTHVDTVPPFIPSSEDDEWIFGRGACDTKGIIAAMLVAGRRLSDEGNPPAFLFVVGEETDSLGAKTAGASGRHARHIVVGEPTDNRLATGHKGVLSYTLSTTGIPAHSAYPEFGSSAIHVLLDVLNDIRGADWGNSEQLGPATLNVGTISGGQAANVFADRAETTLMHRIVDEVAGRIQQLERIVADRADITYHSYSNPQMLLTLEGFDTVSVRFGTDIPHMKGMGELLLAGPGSIHDAHTVGEKISRRQLERAVDLYYALYHALSMRMQ